MRAHTHTHTQSHTHKHDMKTVTYSCTSFPPPHSPTHTPHTLHHPPPTPHRVLLSSARVFSDHLEEELLQVLSDLACYFKEPTKSNLSHEEYQQEMYTLRERQGLFKRQGALQFTLTVIMETTRHRGKKTLAVQQQLYQLLGVSVVDCCIIGIVLLSALLTFCYKSL